MGGDKIFNSKDFNKKIEHEMKLNPHLFICPDCGRTVVVEWTTDIPSRDIIIHKKCDCCDKIFDEERHRIREFE